MLLGRAEERRQIDELLTTARSGESAVLAILGEAGIGKSALLSYAATSSDGFAVLRAKGVESESHIPFGSLLELLRPVLPALERIPKPQAVALESALALRPAEPAERFAVGAATLSVLAASAEVAPLAVLIDDAQWLDASSAEAFRFAVRRLVADPIAVFIAVRKDEPSFVDGAGLPTRLLTGLGPGESAELLAGATLGPELARRAFEATGGNPLALLELAHHVDLLQVAGEGGPVVPVPTAISREFIRRAHSLDEAAGRVLVLAATHGPGDAATVQRAARVLGLDYDALVRAEVAGLIALKDGRIEFRHPLARSAVYDSAPADLRRACHRALASVMPDLDVERRAWHLASAAVGTDPSASAALCQAGERARDRSAYAVAAAAFEKAAWLAPGDDSTEQPVGGPREDRATLLWSAAQAAWQAGIPDYTRRLLSSAFQQSRRPGLKAQIAHLEGQIALHRGPVMDGHAVLLAAVSYADADYAVELLADAALACFYAGKPEEMIVVAERTTSLLSENSSDRARFFATMTKGMAHILGGNWGEGMDQVRAAAAIEPSVSLGTGAGDPGLATWRIMAPMWLREDVAARELVDEALETARARAAVGALPFLLNHLARDQAGGDQWAAANACYDEAIRLSRETGQRTELAMALSGLAWLEARQGAEDSCRVHAREAREICDDLGMGFFRVWTTAAIAELDLGLGHTEIAARQFEQQADELRALRVTDPDLAPAAELVEAYVRLGRRDEAIPLAEAFRDAAVAKGQSWSLARARRASGLVASDDEFELAFEEALRLHGETPDAFERARTQLAYGARLRRTRRRVLSRPQLRAALETFDRLGARPWAELAGRELRASGETVLTRAKGALENLTPQELQIGLLLSSGMSTREAAAALFVSPKTIEYHLRHVYQKLGIRSRSELSALLPAKQ